MYQLQANSLLQSFANPLKKKSTDLLWFSNHFPNHYSLSLNPRCRSLVSTFYITNENFSKIKMFRCSYNFLAASTLWINKPKNACKSRRDLNLLTVIYSFPPCMETYCSDSVPKGSHQELTFLSGFSSNYVPGVFVFFVQINRAEINSHPLQVTSCIDDINFMTLIDDIKFIISIMHLFFFISVT